MLKWVETGDTLTIRNAHVRKNEFVRCDKSERLSQIEEDTLGPLQTNHPRRLVLYDGENSIRVWRSDAVTGTKNYSTLYELQHAVQEPLQQQALPPSSPKQHIKPPAKKKRKYIYRSLAELQIGT